MVEVNITHLNLQIIFINNKKNSIKVVWFLKIHYLCNVIYNICVNHQPFVGFEVCLFATNSYY